MKRLREKKTSWASWSRVRQMRNRGVGGAQHLQVKLKAAWRRRQKQPVNGLRPSPLYQQ
jgi:hypothetical protein